MRHPRRYAWGRKAYCQCGNESIGRNGSCGSFSDIRDVIPNVCLGSSAEVNANPKVGLLCASKRTPAQSPVGILAKIRAFYFEDEQSEAATALAEPEHAIWDNIVLGAIFADLERLAGRAT